MCRHYATVENRKCNKPDTDTFVQSKWFTEVANVSTEEMMEGIKDAAANAAAAAGDAVTATQEAINVQATKAAEAMAPAEVANPRSSNRS